ncbi:MAG: hypothetical protein ACI93R_003737 [Flavobacteriales bacterium]|jgi:hypothetical protein
MKLIYTHENKILVESTKNHLAQHDINTTLKNEFSSGGIGELSAIDTWPELWLEDSNDYTKAKALLLTLTAQSEAPQWKCEHCNETNEGSFEVCWNCQKEASSVS